ncbi:DUF6166 domain-containing protein [Sulfurimonas sp.]|nr:DUF6166 domain-containing protein [Sulfurimonas sp.]
MSITRNRSNYVFKGHKALLGSKFVTYGEIELSTRYDKYSKSETFNWGDSSSSSKQLAFAILYQLSNEEFANENVIKFTDEVVSNLSSRDWFLDSADVLSWINENSDEDIEQKVEQPLNVSKDRKKRKDNVVKKICKELNITQKNLANILEVPEGTVSSWAVKNEIPRLGKKAIEFYIEKQKNQKIVDSYKDFVGLLNVS